jgi:hypothetical protein
MRLEICTDADETEVVVTYDDECTLRVTQTGSGIGDFKYTNFHKVDDDALAELIKTFCRGLINL